MEAKNSEDRRLHLELLRVVAMLLVIFNHTGTFGYFRFAETQSRTLFFLYLACSVLCTMGVPLFFMVSGALLTDKDESIGTLYRKRVLRMAVVLVLFSFLQYLFSVFVQGKPFDLAQFFKTVYTDQIIPPYWFLYAYLALLMALPPLRRMARGMSGVEYRYVFLLYVLFSGVLPIVQYALTREVFSINLSLPVIATAPVFYFLMGYWLDRLLPLEALSNRRIFALLGASVLCVAASAGMTRLLGNTTGVLSEERSQTFLASLIAIPAVTAFALSRRFCTAERCPRALAAAIRQMGTCTFGVYLLHAMLMDRLMPLLYFLQERIDTFPACIVYVLAVFFCGFTLTWLLKKIPAVNRLL